MPDIFFDTLDAVPAELREFAKEDAGKVVVNVVPKVKLDEFRETNINVSKERDALKGTVTKFVSILGIEDPEAAATQVQELRSVQSRVKAGELVENKGLDEAVAERTKQMRESFETEIQAKARETNAWKDQATSATKALQRNKIDGEVTRAVLSEQSGANHSALADIMQRAYSVFTVSDDGKLIPKNGDAIIYGGDGSTPMSPAEWLGKLREEAPYFFKQSTGGGAGGGDKRNGGFTAEELAKMSPEQKLRLVNAGKLK